MSVAVAPDTLALLLESAVRYALGRRTYVVGVVTSAVRAHWRDVGPGSRAMLRADVEEVIVAAEGASDTVGADIDHREWRALLDWMDGQDVA